MTSIDININQELQKILDEEIRKESLRILEEKRDEIISQVMVNVSRVFITEQRENRIIFEIRKN